MGKKKNGGTRKESKENQSSAEGNSDSGDEKMKDSFPRRAIRRLSKSARQSGLGSGGSRATTGFPLDELRSGLHDLPWRSLMIFVATSTIATSAALLVVMAGVVASQSVWSILVTTGFIAVMLVAVCLLSLVNFIRGVIDMASSAIRSRIVFAVWKYFGTIIQVGCIILVYNFFRVFAWGLFQIPMIYFIPLEVFGTTIPVPVFILGALTSDGYIAMAAYVIATGVTVAGFVTGGLDLLAAVADYAHQGSEDGSSSLYNSFLYILFVTIFPALNIIVAVHLINSYTAILLNQIPVPKI